MGRFLYGQVTARRSQPVKAARREVNQVQSQNFCFLGDEIGCVDCKPATGSEDAVCFRDKPAFLEMGEMLEAVYGNQLVERAVGEGQSLDVAEYELAPAVETESRTRFPRDAQYGFREVEPDGVSSLFRAEVCKSSKPAGQVQDALAGFRLD